MPAACASRSTSFPSCCVNKIGQRLGQKMFKQRCCIEPGMTGIIRSKMITSGFSFSDFYYSVGSGSLPVQVCLGARGTRVEFTNFSVAALQVGQRTDNICFEVSPWSS